MRDRPRNGLDAFLDALQANDTVYSTAETLQRVVERATAPERRAMRRVEVAAALAALDNTIHRIIMDEAHEASAEQDGTNDQH